MTRLDWLRRWFASARSTYVEATWERRFWVLVSLAGLFLGGSLIERMIYFMSSWALVKGASNERALARREMMEERADEAVDRDGG